MNKILSLCMAVLVALAAGAQDPVVKAVTANGVTFNMVEVEGGRFNMGGTAEQYNCEDDEFPIHVVALDDYYIADTEVTQALWVAVMGNNPSGITGDLNRPVEMVSWYECHDFIDKLNALTGQTFRLPTESEWEYAARGGRYTQLYQYSGSDDIDEVCWYSGNSGGTSHPVASLQPNELGLYDMCGNVFEWCEDYYGDYDMMPAENPTGPDSGEERVRRGDCWDGSAHGSRITFRIGELPGWHSNCYGFRLAATNIVDEPSGIGRVAQPEPATDGTRYNLLGQPVGPDHTGIVIHDGEKHLAK